MKYLSVCAGIEAASVAWHHMGWEPVAFSEIEKFPSAVLAHHYPNVPNWGDMTKFKEWPDACLCRKLGHAKQNARKTSSSLEINGRRESNADLHSRKRDNERRSFSGLRSTTGATCNECNGTIIDVLVGGTPCQSFSVAGLRKGLDDPRGNLMLTFGAIAQRYRPEWLVWENVPGVLSSNDGRDFGAFLGMLAELGYGFAYRVLDAQYFGVAQRRRRVFVVGHLGNWQRAAAVLFERHSLSGHSAPSRQARKGTAGGVALGIDERGIPQTVGALTDGAHNGGGSMGRMPTQVAYSPPLANCLTQRMYKGINTTLDEGQTPIVTTGGVFDVAGTLGNRGLRSHTELDGHGAYIPVAIGLDEEQNARIDGFGTLKARMEGGGFEGTVMTPAMQVRRLTPVECERLQGFPDGYTNIPWRGKPESPDGPRYKALGNSMAVPVMRYIGERISKVAQL